MTVGCAVGTVALSLDQSPPALASSPFSLHRAHVLPLKHRCRLEAIPKASLVAGGRVQGCQGSAGTVQL